MSPAVSKLNLVLFSGFYMGPFNFKAIFSVAWETSQFLIYSILHCLESVIEIFSFQSILQKLKYFLIVSFTISGLLRLKHP